MALECEKCKLPIADNSEEVYELRFGYLEGDDFHAENAEYYHTGCI